MSLQNRPFSRTSLYDATTTANTNASSTASQQPAARFLPPHILTSRIAEKQAEYENLSQLRDLSAALASQMENLESKLQCLADGTESVAEVLANWQNVFRAINLATVKVSSLAGAEGEERTLPEMLVRIPVNPPEESKS